MIAQPVLQLRKARVVTPDALPCNQQYEKSFLRPVVMNRHLRRSHSCYIVILAGILYSIVLIASTLYLIPLRSLVSPLMEEVRVHKPTEFPVASSELPPTRIKCIRSMNPPLTREGIGAQVWRHGLLFALAEVFGADVELVPGSKNRTSTHGYYISDFFGKCTDTEAACELYQGAKPIDLCPLGDCTCVRNVLIHLTRNLPSKCRTLVVDVDGLEHRHYVGCYNTTIRKYLGTPKRLVAPEYAAIHHRLGDIADKSNGKKFSAVELQAMVGFLCSIPNDKIIIVTEGNPALPTCDDRLFIANDSSVIETVNLFSYATSIAVGLSSYASLISQGTHARRFLSVERGVVHHMWSRSARWTIFSNRGAPMHFRNTEEMKLAAIQPGRFGSLIHRQGQDLVFDRNQSIGSIDSWKTGARSWRELL